MPKQVRSALTVLLTMMSIYFVGAAAFAQGNLERFSVYLQSLEEGSIDWPSRVESIIQRLEAQQQRQGAMALTDANRQLYTMRLITKDGIKNTDTADLAYYKVAKAKLSLTLARSGVSRAITAVTSQTSPGHDAFEELVEFGREMDQSLNLEVPSAATGDAQ
jgi:hypothetical protein